MDMGLINAVLQENQCTKAEERAFPDDWPVSREDGYLVCDKYMKNPKAVMFVARLVERTHCDLFDAAAHCAITLREWLAVTAGYTKS
jgi:hypothetical protein